MNELFSSIWDLFLLVSFGGLFNFFMLEFVFLHDFHAFPIVQKSYLSGPPSQGSQLSYSAIHESKDLTLEPTDSVWDKNL